MLFTALRRSWAISGAGLLGIFAALWLLGWLLFVVAGDTPFSVEIRGLNLLLGLGPVFAALAVWALATWGLEDEGGLELRGIGLFAFFMALLLGVVMTVLGLIAIIANLTEVATDAADRESDFENLELWGSLLQSMGVLGASIVPVALAGLALVRLIQLSPSDDETPVEAEV
jgi:hypothetical protein